MHGYTVFLAEDGMRAIELFKSNREAIDLVVLDLTMPQRSGMEVLRAIRRIDPAMRVILSSGSLPRRAGSRNDVPSEAVSRRNAGEGRPLRPRRPPAGLRRPSSFHHHPFLIAALMAARKMYPERCISVSDSSGSTSIDAMHG